VQGFFAYSCVEPVKSITFANSNTHCIAVNPILQSLQFGLFHSRKVTHMALETMFEKLQLKDEKNLLIQGLPSSIEKQFSKLFFCKSVTPLLRSRRIDFALVFAISKKQLFQILDEVIPSLQEEGKLWIAYPKLSSKIASDLSRDENWQIMGNYGYSAVRQIALDNVWTALRFKKSELVNKSVSAATDEILNELVNMEERTISVPEEVKILFKKNKPAGIFFETLSFTNQKEYVQWIAGAKKEETKTRRLDSLVEKLSTGKKNPSAK